MKKSKKLSRKQREHNARQAVRNMKLNQKANKLASAKICYENGRAAYDKGDEKRVLYWEYEYRRSISEANSIGMGA